MLRSLIKNQELVGGQRHLGVCLPLVVREFDFVRTIQQVHDCPDPAAQETVRRQIRKESNDIQQARCAVH